MTLNGDLKAENRRLWQTITKLKAKLRKMKESRDNLLKKHRRLVKIEKLVQKLVLVFKENAE